MNMNFLQLPIYKPITSRIQPVLIPKIHPI